MTGRGSAFRRTNPELFRCSWCLVTGRAYAKTENRWPRITQWHLHQIEFRFRPVMYHIWLECRHVTNHSQRFWLTVGIGGFPNGGSCATQKYPVYMPFCVFTGFLLRKKLNLEPFRATLSNQGTLFPSLGKNLRWLMWSRKSWILRLRSYPICISVPYLCNFRFCVITFEILSVWFGYERECVEELSSFQLT